eukprot:5584933-Pyramimonas_sp.AAC.1
MATTASARRPRCHAGRGSCNSLTQAPQQVALVAMSPHDRLDVAAPDEDCQPHAQTLVTNMT